MAKNTIKPNRPLNPMAPPYLKLTPTQFYINPFLHSTPPLISYNVHFQPRRSFPHSSSLTPVPTGPRIPIPRRRRRVNKVGGGEVTWRPKLAEKKTTVNVIGRKRWKNRSGDFHQILPLESKTTSLMIKNIPNKYTNGANAGFAFVNFTNPKAALRFRDAFHGKRWEFFSDSPKVAEISRARIQGKKAIVNHFKMARFACASDEDLPVLFEPARDGSGQFENGVCLTLGWSWTPVLEDRKQGVKVHPI
ncbi:hypothetical protein L1987_48668 [Smallanthus sonchifolius]|uniref:Uncharacterized protein n=1 Tax=Smallanthus sonchifolius TaxID=185202 RepID=A0ACB9FSK8_9ASTR|nr:hypothetical protein L1987_48668 [Smallanthus sonchifolius]